MSLESLYYISEILAVIAVIVSLLFVGLQLRAQNKEARLASMREAHKEWRDLLRYAIENDEINQIMWFKFRPGGFDALTPGEALRINQHASMFANYWEEMFHRFTEERLEEDHFRNVEAKMINLIASKGGKEVVQLILPHQSKAFCAYYHSEIVPKIEQSILNEDQLAARQIIARAGFYTGNIDGVESSPGGT